MSSHWTELYTVPTTTLKLSRLRIILRKTCDCLQPQWNHRAADRNMLGLLLLTSGWKQGGTGRTFTLLRQPRTWLSLGGIVSVRLRGRRLRGLVTGCRCLEDDLKRSNHFCLWMLCCSGRRSMPTGVTGSMPWRPSVIPVLSGCSKRPCHLDGWGNGLLLRRLVVDCGGLPCGMWRHPSTSPSRQQL